MAEGYYSETLKKLKRAGFILKRHGKGDHEIYADDKHRQVVLPYRLNSKHIATKILKQAGLG